MKKYIALLLFLVMALIAPSLVHAAGTVTCTDYSYSGISKNREIRFITYSVTFGADASSPANVALESIVASAHNGRPSLQGWWILRVDYMYGATGPTDDTDFRLWRSYGEDKIDVLGGNGVDFIDNATNNSIYPATTSQPLSGKEIFDIDNNSVNNATCTIVFILYR